MTHRKLTLFGANKRPPKSRSRQKFGLSGAESARQPPKSSRWTKKISLGLQAATTTSKTVATSAALIAALAMALGVLVLVAQCEAARIEDDDNNADTQDKFSETIATATKTTTSITINASQEEQQQQMNLSSSSESSAASSIGEDSMKFPLYMRIIATLFCLLIFSVGVCGNLLVPLVVIKTKYLRNSTNLFLINLSIADLLVLIVCMPTVLIELHSRPETWLLGEPMCKYTA